MTGFVRMGMLVLVIGWMGCGGRMPEDLGVDKGMFSPCSDKPIVF